MKFFKRHWFKILILLPFIPVGILVYAINRLTVFDSSLRILASFFLIVVSFLLFCFGLYLELSKREVENKKIQHKIQRSIGNLIGRGVVGILIIAFLYASINSYIIVQRFVDFLDDITVDDNGDGEEDVQLGRYYSFVAMSDFDVSNQGSYGRIGTLAVTDEAKAFAVEEFLPEQNFIPNYVQTTFNSPLDMITALYDDEVDAIIIGSNFVQIFEELNNFEDIEQETIVLAQFNVEVEHIERTEIDPREPFSILLLGLNSRNDMESGNINTFMLLTINLEELSFTAVSIPRDSYVEIPCHYFVRDKLSHTNLGGPDCAVGAIEHMFDMEIPHYVMLNFNGFMEIIDVLGGIEVDVPISFSEQDSRRRFGEHRIHIEAGPQRLNAEEALALTRHRNSFLEQDFVRVENQQLVFQAMLREMFDQVNGINDILPLLEVIGQHVETNLSSYDITNIAQYMLGLLQNQQNSDLMDNIHFINMVILGDTPVMNVRNYGFLSVVLPWPRMIEEARRLMMINLGLAEPEFSFTFEFDGFARPRGRQWGQIDETYGSSGTLPTETPVYEPVEPAPPPAIDPVPPPAIDPAPPPQIEPAPPPAIDLAPPPPVETTPPPPPPEPEPEEEPIDEDEEVLDLL